MSERVYFDLLKVGHCRHAECMAVRGASWRVTEFPSLCGLIKHPERGWMLYDTGYAEHFFEATQPFPERLYRMATPVTLPGYECLLGQLARRGIRAADISHVLVSHFHGDHIAGLKDFPACRFIALRCDWEQVRRPGRWRGVFRGFLPALLPGDFTSRLQLADDKRSIALPSWLKPFEYGLDLFADGSLIAVPLPGHSSAQMGLLLRDQHDRVRLLVADACWSLPACAEGRMPSRLASLLFADQRDYLKTFMGLQRILQHEPAVSLVPSHCASTWAAWESVDA
jgi:glyoxylase-like metal-dependent hydrolase (beta-lactamase superfamily II)